MATASALLDTGYHHFDAGVRILGTIRVRMAARSEGLSRSSNLA